MSEETHTEKFGGVWCPAEVLISDLSDNELRIWLRIRSFQGKENSECFASNEYLAKDLKKTPNHVSAMIANLVERGYLTRRFDENGRRFLRAIIALRKIVTLTEDNKGGYDKSLGGVTINRNIEYKDENTQIDHTPFSDKKVKRKGYRKIEYPVWFTDKFWSICPLGTKSDGYLSAETIPEHERERISTRLQQSVAKLKSVGRRHRDLSTWINQMGWEDDYESTCRHWLERGKSLTREQRRNQEIRFGRDAATRYAEQQKERQRTMGWE